MEEQRWSLIICILLEVPVRSEGVPQRYMSYVADKGGAWLTEEGKVILFYGEDS